MGTTPPTKVAVGWAIETIGAAVSYTTCAVPLVSSPPG